MGLRWFFWRTQELRRFFQVISLQYVQIFLSRARCAPYSSCSLLVVFPSSSCSPPVAFLDNLSIYFRVLSYSSRSLPIVFPKLAVVFPWSSRSSPVAFRLNFIDFSCEAHVCEETAFEQTPQHFLVVVRKKVSIWKGYFCGKAVWLI